MDFRPGPWIWGRYSRCPSRAWEPLISLPHFIRGPRPRAVLSRLVRALTPKSRIARLRCVLGFWAFRDSAGCRTDGRRVRAATRCGRVGCWARIVRVLGVMFYYTGTGRCVAPNSGGDGDRCVASAHTLPQLARALRSFFFLY